MSVGIVLITHGKIGEILLRCCIEIYGSNPLNVAVIGICPNDQPEPIEKKLQNTLNKIDGGQGILILTDMIGATPCNIATRSIKNRNAKIISGINLPMVLKLFNYHELELNEISEKALFAGGNSISIINTERQA